MKLILFKTLEREELFLRFFSMLDESNVDSLSLQKEEFQWCFRELVAFGETYGLYGNLWHNYLTCLLVNDENPYSMGCEINGEVKGSTRELAALDLEAIRQLFLYSKDRLEKLSIYSHNRSLFSFFENYQDNSTGRKVYNRRIADRISTLSQKLAIADSNEVFMEEVTKFYQEYGVGKLGLHKAFRLERKSAFTSIVPITNITHVTLDDLVGYQLAKKKLQDNTQAFVMGKKANNCLLYGDAGTGKSSCIKAIANEYYRQGLRIIEVYKHQFEELNEVISQIKNRNYKFILYMDDLSFEEFEIEYKYLKAVIEGGLEKKPDNILIYATSNRRHLVREKFSDKKEILDDLHGNDTVAEKLSLSARFGVQIYFGRPEKKEFQEIVMALAERNQLNMREEVLLQEANKWELSHGGPSGRGAQQFIDYLMGQTNG